jgi:hypothetical protein
LTGTDTIDLQDRDAPSAQDHLRIKTTSTNGSLRPHQAETLREVAAESAEENLRSPRLSWSGGDPGDLHQYAEDLAAEVANSINRTQNGKMQSTSQQQQQQQDALAIAQNGGVSMHDNDDTDMDTDGEGDLDDDMMDKISSSPSIEDGASTFTTTPISQLRYVDGFPESSTLPRRQASPFPILTGVRSSSQYLYHHETLPLELSDQHWELDSKELSRTHHHLPKGKLPDQHQHEHTERPTTPDLCSWNEGDSGGEYDEDLKDEACDMELDDLTIPYHEDDDGSFSDIQDPRFLDSGWGGECLQDTEDIDFEFVYALHTFVATVEGQANATKGDTMVLLDDTNSYWWLVRVVKDNSIGMYQEPFPSLKLVAYSSILGYLPAEHIETPTERLARLNKHRNIDVCPWHPTYKSSWSRFTDSYFSSRRLCLVTNLRSLRTR